jgi:hypothetical protein
MTDFLVTCCTKSGNNYQNITHLGGTDNGGWVKTKEVIIGEIERNIHQFHTIVPHTQQRAYVEVVAEGTAKYLRTRANGTLSDNLLSLNSCSR